MLMIGSPGAKTTHSTPLAQRNMAYSELKKSFPADSALVNNFITTSCHKRWERAWEGDASCSSPPCLHVNEGESSLDRPENLIGQNTRWPKRAVASQRISTLGTSREVRILPSSAREAVLCLLVLQGLRQGRTIVTPGVKFVNRIDN